MGPACAHVKPPEAIPFIRGRGTHVSLAPVMAVVAMFAFVCTRHGLELINRVTI